MKSSKKSFTLVELIIVIAIIAILAVTAFLMLTKWIAKSRDSSRLSDINTIDNALQVYLTEKSSLPKPENYTLIYASGISNIVGYQGDFSDNIAKNLGNLSKAPKDALDNNYYNYYVDSTSTKYQLLGYTEQTSSVSSTANAVDYSSRYIRIAGDKLGILTDVNNAPVNKLGLTGLDIALTTGTYKAYFDSSTSVSGTGASLVSMMTLNNKNISYLDTGLVFYSDMETTINSGGVVMLKDLSKYGNNGTCYNSGTAGNCGSVGPIFVNGAKGKSMQFDGIDDYINISSGYSILNWGSGFFTMKATFNISNISSNGNIILRIGWGCRTPGYQIAIGTDGKVSFGNWDGVAGGNQLLVTSKSLLTNNWYNVIAVSDGKIIKFFVNGNLIGTNTYSQVYSPISNMPLDIGANKGICPNYSVFHNGSIDEVRIYNRALSDDEVKALYSAN